MFLNLLIKIFYVNISIHNKRWVKYTSENYKRNHPLLICGSETRGRPQIKPFASRYTSALRTLCIKDIKRMKKQIFQEEYTFMLK